MRRALAPLGLLKEAVLRDFNSLLRGLTRRLFLEAPREVCRELLLELWFRLAVRSRLRNSAA